jgi:hypothetical protein
MAVELSNVKEALVMNGVAEAENVIKKFLLFKILREVKKL